MGYLRVALHLDGLQCDTLFLRAVVGNKSTSHAGSFGAVRLLKSLKYIKYSYGLQKPHHTKISRRGKQISFLHLPRAAKNYYLLVHRR